MLKLGNKAPKALISSLDKVPSEDPKGIEVGGAVIISVRLEVVE